nr:glutamate dehydrogenase [Actinomycetota bacterium]
REISYLFGQYKRMQNRFTGILTGKGLTFGGSLVRTEATGYGCAYFAEQALRRRGQSLEGSTCAVSGSGNVAIYTAEKASQLGARVVTLSDSDGAIHDRAGIDEEKLGFVKDLKEVRRGRIAEYAERYGCEYLEGRRPWSVPCDVALPCATQNEMDEADAKTLLANGCQAIVEGANMPATLDAVHLLQDAGVLFLPGKAANAGGVAVSGLEQSQNALRISWSHEEVHRRLRAIMSGIHEQCVQWGDRGDGTIDYVRGSNLAAFQRIAPAMLAYGIV